MSGERKRKVAYFYDRDVGSVYYGHKHPMKPHRLTMTHHMVVNYGLHKFMEVYKPRRAYPTELASFHTPEYINFLATATPWNLNELKEESLQYNINDDCPVFDGLYDFCRLYAGASIEAANKINNGMCDIAINWSGGLHHAKKGEASGFCYVNDLVLAILELLKVHARVLYIDIDIHHGDGVEEAFYLSDRVMTVSFHMHGNFFFPGTGDITDIGEKHGRYYSLNVPLAGGVDNATFHRLFKPIMRDVIASFQPGAIVLQCGADSLAGDRLGMFNLTIEGHAEAVNYMKGFNIPMIVTGGGGYTKTNVARCWCFETAKLVGQDIPSDIPANDVYYDYYAPGHQLNLGWSRQDLSNHNPLTEQHNILEKITENLRRLQHAPGVQMKEMPPAAFLPEYQAPEGDDMDKRLTKYAVDHGVVREDEFYDNPMGLLD
ncbi:hypothetical protein WJX73_002207 [Symbiochloris irregularis]|uniref:Histone deacetylase n=1 Tax=Symbiochloris irregularis TaxID=706552 RepID=A0AAW1PF01_9CHLO